MKSVLNSRRMSLASYTECVEGLGFVGDERCAKPYDKRSVRGAAKKWDIETSEMLNGWAAGGTSPTYTAWAASESPRTLRLSWGFTYSPSPMVSDYGMLMGERSNILASARGYKGVSFNPYLFGSKDWPFLRWRRSCRVRYGNRKISYNIQSCRRKRFNITLP